MLAACRGAPESTPPAETGPPRFPHAAPAPLALACQACHPADLPRPVPTDHAPCDACHREPFAAVPGRFCRICHERVDVLDKSPVVYPPVAGPRAVAAEFSHETHLDQAKMEAKVGHHL